MIPEEPRTVTLIKGADRYIFRFDHESRQEIIRTLGQFYKDRSLNFDLFDAELMREQIETGYRSPLIHHLD